MTQWRRARCLACVPEVLAVWKHGSAVHRRGFSGGLEGAWRAPVKGGMGAFHRDHRRENLPALRQGKTAQFGTEFMFKFALNTSVRSSSWRVEWVLWTSWTGIPDCQVEDGIHERLVTFHHSDTVTDSCCSETFILVTLKSCRRSPVNSGIFRIIFTPYITYSAVDGVYTPERVSFEF